MANKLRYHLQGHFYELGFLILTYLGIFGSLVQNTEQKPLELRNEQVATLFIQVWFTNGIFATQYILQVEY